MFDLVDLEQAADLVHRFVPPTPQYRWPLLAEASGVDLWVKHENHTPTGAFKVRGGVVYLHDLRARRPDVRMIVTATRGNHGQSLALAGALVGIDVVIVVPHGNSPEKNLAMQAFGATLVEHGADFDAAREHAAALAEATGAFVVPSFDPLLVRGVATYALELFQAVPDLAAVYVPIGMGSGICGLIKARDRLGLRTEIVGVVAEGAPAYRLSLEQGRIVTTETARTFADGMACRVPHPDALAVIREGAARIVTLSEAAIADAIRLYFRATHNVAEGAGAAPLAALLQERGRMQGERVAVVLCGGNLDSDKFREVLAGGVPEPF